MAAFDLASYIDSRKALIDSHLARVLPQEDIEPRDVSSAMRYGVLGGGKRIRPMLALEVAEIGGYGCETVADAASAIELVHAASLILDDLPSMDDALTRRNQPCTHTVYGESTAILAAMDLIAVAYRLAAENAERHECPAAPVVAHLSVAIGHEGIVRGQYEDLALGGKRASIEQLAQIYAHKAAALFLAAVRIPARILGMDAHTTRALERYAENLGLAFQITDDLLDADHAPEDAGRSTFVSLLGKAEATRKAGELVEDAAGALQHLGPEATVLKALAEYVGTRKH